MPLHLLDNIVWNSLSGAHAKYSMGTSTARRYAPGFSPIIGFAENERPDFAALVPHCEPGEHFYCGGWSGPVPTGWEVHTDTVACQMLWEGPLPEADATLAAVRLGPEHVPRMLELVAFRPPGPFAARTVELGEYFGVFEGERLVSMAGERMEAGEFREISGVCTHPGFQGRGHARRLMLALIRRQMQRGLHPFLHVMRDNVDARRIYERMGFRDRQAVVLRVISRAP
jgi:GNAT superfamily N-acetyltransferase